VILDNYAAHKDPKVREWLERHTRFTFHFTPTSCSWLNAVEGFFARLTKRRLKHGVFHPLVDLQVAINRFLAEHNQSSKPFVWTADPDKIIAAVRRGHQVLDSIHYGVCAVVLTAPCAFAIARKSRGVMPNSRRNALLNVPESEKPHRNAMSVIDARL